MVSNIFYFHPYLGKWSNLTHVFQMGWFNHQPVNLFNGYFHGFSHGFPWFGILISPDKGEFSDASASNGSNSNFAWTIAYAPCAFHWNSRKLGIPCWYHPCRRYFPTFGWFFMVNIGKYTIDAVGFWIPHSKLMFANTWCSFSTQLHHVLGICVGYK